MFTEETGTGFFSRIKNAFTANENTVVVDDKPTEFAEEKTNGTDEMMNANVTERSNYPTAPANNESVTEREIPLRTVGVTAPSLHLPNEKDLDIRFATKFIAAGGKFVFCESIKEAIENLKILKMENDWSHVFCWENEIKDAFCESNFQKGSIGFTIENSDAAISLCECLVAEDGTILLNPKQASRRRLPCFPKTHIIITDLAHVASTEADALHHFKQMHKGELPSIIKLGSCNSGHFYDKQRLILNAEGTEDVYVFLVDEIIPPSLRP
jgi:L-lactate dehydrogenase complex protein LldG